MRSHIKKLLGIAKPTGFKMLRHLPETIGIFSAFLIFFLVFSLIRQVVYIQYDLIIVGEIIVSIFTLFYWSQDNQSDIKNPKECLLGIFIFSLLGLFSFYLDYHFGHLALGNANGKFTIIDIHPISFIFSIMLFPFAPFYLLASGIKQSFIIQ